jgi:hypothetical protein
MKEAYKQTDHFKEHSPSAANSSLAAPNNPSLLQKTEDS